MLREAEALKETARFLAADQGKELSDAGQLVAPNTTDLPALTEQNMFSEQMDLSEGAKAQKNLAISETMSPDRLAKAARAKGMSLRGLAKKMGISPGSLIDYRKGVRPIPKRHAEWIERELGLAPTRALWPRGVDDR